MAPHSHPRVASPHAHPLPICHSQLNWKIEIEIEIEIEIWIQTPMKTSGSQGGIRTKDVLGKH